MSATAIWVLVAATVCLVGCATGSKVAMDPEAERIKREKTAIRLGVPTEVELDPRCAGPLVVERSKFTYPGVALLAHTEGWVVVRIDLDGSGRASKVVVENSRPRGVFDSSAIEWVKEWHFSEGAVRTRCVVVLTYSLDR